jgi:4-carboxymuconolactone decarboxylase
MTADQEYEAGEKVRREVLGDDVVDQLLERRTAFTTQLDEFVTRHAWGAVWTRDGLDRRTRSVITLAVLTTLRAHEELAVHVMAARTNGLTDEEIGEVLLHTGVYAGVPAARAAFGVAAKALGDPSAAG